MFVLGYMGTVLRETEEVPSTGDGTVPPYETGIVHSLIVEKEG